MNFLGFKQMLLKGKDFVIKKLDELQIQRSELDYVAQQIPRRLHKQLKVFQKSQIDLDSADQYSPYFKMYPNHPVSPILFDTIQKNKQQIQYEIKDTLKPHLPSLPEFPPEIEQKAFRLKHAVDTYKEPMHDLENTIVGIYVVYFHHKKGTEVEFMYPASPLTQSVGSRILHYAMPDSSHHKSQDYNFFNLQFSDSPTTHPPKMLFGVSYFKQIKLTEEMKTKQQDLTRSHLQKAVCIVSVLPVFGYLKMRLSQTTKLFFEDFTNFQSIKHAYNDISNHLNETWKMIDINELYIGTDLRNIAKIFKYKLMEMYKAILYQKRVVVFSHSSSSSSSFILSLLTLFPGMVTFGMENQPINRYNQMLREFALPLHLFSRKNPLIISFHIQEFHLLDEFEKAAGRHFLIGTTNRLVKETKKISTQVLLNLEDCTLQFTDIDEGGWQGLTSEDKQFMNNLLSVIESTGGESYEGSEDWVREQFHNYLKERLVRIVEGKNMYRKFVKECELYQASLKNKQKSLEKGEKEKQLNVPYINPKILEIPFPYLLSKPSFTHFLQFHNPNIYLLAPHSTTQEIFLISPNDYYLGKLPKTNKLSIKYSQKSRKLQYSNQQGITKQLRFNQEDQVISIEIGRFQGNHLAQGNKLTETEFYIGQLYDGQYNGEGKLVKEGETYIGSFDNGVFHGKGQLVKSDKSIYLGEWKEGVKEGKGRYQDERVVKDGVFEKGEFVQGEVTDIEKKTKVEGNFKNGEIVEEEKYLYTFEDGNRFFGYLKEGLPEGVGIWTKVGEESVKAEFLGGKFEKQIENVQSQDVGEEKQAKEDKEQKQNEELSLVQSEQKAPAPYKLEQKPLIQADPITQQIQKPSLQPQQPSPSPLPQHPNQQ